MSVGPGVFRESRIRFTLIIELIQNIRRWGTDNLFEHGAERPLSFVGKEILLLGDELQSQPSHNDAQ